VFASVNGNTNIGCRNPIRNFLKFGSSVELKGPLVLWWWNYMCSLTIDHDVRHTAIRNELQRIHATLKLADMRIKDKYDRYNFY
jgi:hypothetical protein